MKTLRVVFLPLLAILVIACSSSGDAEKAEPGQQEVIQFLRPNAGATLNGVVDVEAVLDTPEPLARLTFEVDGEAVDVPRLSPTFQVDTRHFADGSHVLTLRAEGDSGAEWSRTLPLNFDNPDFEFLGFRSAQPSYLDGETVTLALDYSAESLELAADFSTMDSAFDASRVESHDLGGGHYELRYRLSLDNTVEAERYPVRITATSPLGEALTMPLQLRLAAAARTPIVVKDALFVSTAPAERPSASPAASSSLAVEGPSVLLTDESQPLRVSWDPTLAVERLRIAAAGLEGHYLLPVQGNAASTQLRLSAHHARPELTGVELLVDLLDGAGNVVANTTLPVDTLNVNAAALSVSVSWDSDADLDLAVATPEGSTLSYLHPSTGSGGLFELDANSMCERSASSVERVSWPLGSEPAGAYTVHLSQYESCSAESTHYKVTVRACGQEQIYEGDFLAEGEESEPERNVASFEVDCQPSVHGQVRFEHGYPTVEPKPAAYVPIRMVSAAGDGAVIASDETDEDGYFRFDLPTNPGAYRFEVEANWTPPGDASPRLSVVELESARPHRFHFDPGAADSLPDGGFLLTVREEESSGALNILDVGRQVLLWSAQDQRPLPPALVARWTRGKSESAGGTFYDENAVWISGAPAMVDEFDDAVVAHEFFHHVAVTCSAVSGGGEHMLTRQYHPTLAWSEGVATGLAQHVMGTSKMTDLQANGRVYLLADIESRPEAGGGAASVFRGTHDGTMSGSLSELLPAMIVWDLLDPANEAHDALPDERARLARSFFEHMPESPRADRGAPGPDLVDFLDGWRANSGTSSDTELCTLLQEREFPYEGADGWRCRP